MTAALLVAVCAAATIALVAISRVRPGGAAEWVVKPIASTAFVALAVAEGALDTTFGTVLLVGLGFAWWGDMFLVSKSKPAFLAGLVSFLLGHVGYAVAFAVRGLDPLVTLGGLAAAGVVAIPVGRWLLPSVEPAMKLPVLAYMTVISSMVGLSLGTVAAHGNAWIAVGAIAFYASDLAVARDRFVAPGWINRLWGLPVYFGAQLVLAWCAGRP